MKKLIRDRHNAGKTVRLMNGSPTRLTFFQDLPPLSIKPPLITLHVTELNTIGIERLSGCTCMDTSTREHV